MTPSFSNQRTHVGARVKKLTSQTLSLLLRETMIGAGFPKVFSGFYQSRELFLGEILTILGPRPLSLVRAVNGNPVR